jgi:drug/metabolite transporter (DMT)-like permease
VWTARIALALLTTLLLWSSAFAVIRVGLRELSPGHLALLRFGTACVVLWILVAVQGVRSGTWPRIEKRDWALFLAGGALGTTAYHALLNWGEQHVAAGPASFLIATAPMWGLLFAHLAGERTPRGVWGGVIVALCGVFLISWGQDPAAGVSGLLNPSALLILGAALSGGASGPLYKALLARGVSELHLTAITTTIGTVLLLPFAPGLTQEIAQAPREAVAAGVYLGIFPTSLAYLAWTYAIKRAGLTFVLPFLYLIPVLASAMAWAILREVPTTLSLAGGGIVLAGVIAAQRSKMARRAST